MSDDPPAVPDRFDEAAANRVRNIAAGQHAERVRQSAALYRSDLLAVNVVSELFGIPKLPLPEYLRAERFKDAPPAATVRAELESWHAAKAATGRWRQVKDERPVDGVAVLRCVERPGGQPRKADVADITDGMWWFSDPLIGELPVEPDDWWQPITLPAEREGGNG